MMCIRVRRVPIQLVAERRTKGGGLVPHFTALENMMQAGAQSASQPAAISIAAGCEESSAGKSSEKML